jgi:aspartate/methionine/tyrosine aminotransferase
MRFTNTARITSVVNAISKLASGRLCSPTPTQYAIRPALEGTKEFLGEFVQEIRKRRDYAIERIKAISGLSSDVPSAAFYLMMRVADLKNRTDEKFALELLEKTGVLVVHGSGFGLDPFDGYFRLVYLASEEVLESTFDAIQKLIKAR